MRKTFETVALLSETAVLEHDAGMTHDSATRQVCPSCSPAVVGQVDDEARRLLNVLSAANISSARRSHGYETCYEETLIAGLRDEANYLTSVIDKTAPDWAAMEKILGRELMLPFFDCDYPVEVVRETDRNSVFFRTRVFAKQIQAFRKSVIRSGLGYQVDAVASDGLFMPVLRTTAPVGLVCSSPGRFHLVLGKSLARKVYGKVLAKWAKVGVVDRFWVDASNFFPVIRNHLAVEIEQFRSQMTA